jgi:hypothetical protein
MTQVKMNEMLPGQAIEIVHELRGKGYGQGIDFDFAYYPIFDDGFTGLAEPSHVVFTFYKESLATWFTLRYQ